jgi:uncharacterized protein (DUF2062 family)
VRRFIQKCRKQKDEESPNERSLSPQELQESELFWIKEAQKSLADRIAKGEFKSLTPFRDGSDKYKCVFCKRMAQNLESSWQISQISVWHHLPHRFTTPLVITLVQSLSKLVETRQQNIMEYCSPA